MDKRTYKSLIKSLLHKTNNGASCIFSVTDERLDNVTMLDGDINGLEVCAMRIVEEIAGQREQSFESEIESIKLRKEQERFWEDSLE